MPRLSLPRITNPQASRILVSEQLPAVTNARLQADAIRSRFAAPPIWQVEMPGDGGLFPGRVVRDAAVLVALMERTAGLTVLLTERTAHLNDHAGQISFPGGGRDPQDHSPTDTALREAMEEVGLPASHVQVLGELAVYQTVTAYRVTPVVALVEPNFVVQADSFEVAEVFEVPLSFLMNPANHQRRAIDTPMGERFFYAMPYQDGGKERFIWGATAAMLRNFYRFLSA